MNFTELNRHLPFYFSCPANYVGEYCQYKNPCTSGGQKCQNGGTCNVVMSRTRGPTFQCSCPIGYTASFCEIAVPSNACRDSPCQNGATCTLISLSEYKCTCPLGWKGEPRGSNSTFGRLSTYMRELGKSVFFYMLFEKRYDTHFQ